MRDRIHLVLVDPTGMPLGALAEFAIDEGPWPQVDGIIAMARERHAVDVTILRLVASERFATDPDGWVRTYTAEVADGLPSGLLPPPAAIAWGDEPLRASWARPGGVGAIVAWADRALVALNRKRTGPVEQIKTWNLSNILRIPTIAGVVWAKSVPPFFAHEGRLLRMLAEDRPGSVPTVIASSDPPATVLLEDLGSDEQWDAPVDVLCRMVSTLVDIQDRYVHRIDELLDAGVPDLRRDRFHASILTLVRRSDVRETLASEDLARLDVLCDDLDRRLDALADCGVPETLVHGDFHPGNWIARDGRLVLHDWGDAFIGHPLLDTAAFLQDHNDQGGREQILATWTARWRDVAPASDPEGALALIPPIAALRQALVYRLFLDRIEPTEHQYHEDDVPDWLRIAIGLA
jgi:Phosphotransferase enzyme family